MRLGLGLRANPSPTPPQGGVAARGTVAFGVPSGAAVLAEAQRALCGALNNLGGLCMQDDALD